MNHLGIAKKSNVFCAFPFVIHSVILPTPNSVRKYCGWLDFMKERSSVTFWNCFFDLCCFLCSNDTMTGVEHEKLQEFEPIQIKSLGESPNLADVQFWILGMAQNMSRNAFGKWS